MFIADTINYVRRQKEQKEKVVDMADTDFDMLEIIYDTLFNNKEYEQFDIEKSEDSCINYSGGVIQFDYDGKNYVLKVEQE